MIRRYAYALLLAFTATGLLVSLYALKQHYAPIGTSGCNVSRTFNCDLVNKSEWSELFGFPVAGIGVIGYLLIGIVAMHWSKEKDPNLGKATLVLLAGGLAFSLYLTSIEAFALGAWCLLCLASLSAIVGASLTGVMTYRDWSPKK